MKKILSLIAMCLFAFSANAQEFKFEEETIDYGKIFVGDEGTRTFTFTNVGDEPLIINRVQSTCGCTVPKKPEQPILPGEKGEIEVSYDTSKPGGFTKAITIYSNAKSEMKMVKIKGFVVKKQEKEEAKS